MNLDSVAGIGAAIVTVALVTTIVARPNSANIIRSMGEAFSASLRAAQGR